MVRTSFGKLKDKVYRLLITCPAKHTTYIDYASRKSAETNYAKMQAKSTWYATGIEEVK